MLKPLLAISLFFFATASYSQSPTDTAQTLPNNDTLNAMDTVSIDLVFCPVNNAIAKCKRIKGYTILRKGPAALSCTNSTGTEVIDMQIYLDDQKKIIDKNKFDVFYK